MSTSGLIGGHPTVLIGAEAASLADRVKASRGEFARVFDRIAAARATGTYLDFKMAVLGTGDDRTAYTAAFLKAAEAEIFDELVEELAELRMLDAAAVTVDTNGTLRLTDAPLLGPQDASGVFLTLQGWTPDMLGMVDMNDLFAGILLAKRRVCQVKVGDRGSGTGFLVGPQTVLTNWHVIHSLFDAQTGLARAESARQLSCDFHENGVTYSYPAVKDWLVDWSPLALNAAAGTVQGAYADLTQHKPAPYLDFCVVRLHGAPGRARGWYDLANAGALPTEQRPFFVVQHPAQFPQQAAVCAGVTMAVGADYQIQHRALTALGSSGGLCLNDRLEVVGLHQGEVTRLVKKKRLFVHNLAILGKSIAAASPKISSVDPNHDAIWFLRSRQLAVVGRTGTLGRIAEMRGASATKPILVVRGPSGCGKSFTFDLIDERIEHENRWFARLDAATLPAGARDVAELVLQEAGVPEDDRKKLPVPADAGTTDVAWIKGPLFREFRQALDKVAGTRTLWIVVENLHRVDIPPTGGRRFLDVLYEMAPSTPTVRIVLLGLDGGIPAGDPNRVEYEDLPNPNELDAAEVEAFFEYVCAERGLPVNRREIERVAGIVVASAGQWPASEPGSTKLSRVGMMLSRIVYPESRRWKP